MNEINDLIQLVNNLQVQDVKHILTEQLALQTDSDQKSLLHHLAKIQNNQDKKVEQIAEVLLACKSNVNDKETDGNSAVHLACQYGNLQLLELLLQTEDADFNLKNNIGMSPMAILVSQGQTEMVNKVLQSNKIIQLENAAEDGHTLLTRACLSPNPVSEIIHALITAGSSVSVKMPSGETLFEYLMKQDKSEVASVS
eukprot:TRINITY_DN14023_c0_g1_i6.p1 TRINITY_DN14023_c0_g1~~TRINITY_DN14023_c0_g1_i6.p1  ORF type:complete len:198 (+),score=10.35 TRINITY_DN14023_c0_g1_i6:62-655(+)